MALQQFQQLTADSQRGNTTDDSTAAALENLRRAQAVDRYNNNILPADNVSATGVSGRTGVDTPQFATGTGDITISNNFRPSDSSQGNTYVFANRNITVATGGTIAPGGDGIHIYFINCNIELAALSSPFNGPILSVGKNVNSGGTISSSYEAVRTAGRSISFLGCAITAKWTNTTANQNSIHMSDVFGCTFDTVAGGNTILCADANATVNNSNGNRWENSVFYMGTDAGPDSRIHMYSTLESIAGSEINGMNIAQGYNARKQILFSDTRFLNPYRSNRFFVQDNNAIIGDTMFQNVGYTAPAGTTAGDGLNLMGNVLAPNANLGAYVTTRRDAVNPATNKGGVMNFHGWDLSFKDFTNNGIENVNVKIESNAQLVAGRRTADNAGYNTAGNQVRDAFPTTFEPLLTTAGANSVNRNASETRNYISYIRTNDNGLPVSTNAKSTHDGDVDNAVDGYWDWLRLGRFTTTSSTESTDPEEFVHKNFSDGFVPRGRLVAPVLSVRNNRATTMGASIQARSASHNIDRPEVTVSGNVGYAAGETAPGGYTPVETVNVTAGPRPGWKFSTSGDPEAENLFSTAAARTYQDLFNHTYTEWAAYRMESNDDLVSISGNTMEFRSSRALTLNAAGTTDLNNTTTYVIQNTNGFSTTATGDIITGIKVNGDLTLPTNATLFQDTESTGDIAWSGTTPTTIINGATIKGTLRLPASATPYEIVGGDISGLTIERSSASGSVVINVTSDTVITGVDISDANVDINRNLTASVTGVAAADQAASTWSIWRENTGGTFTHVKSGTGVTISANSATDTNLSGTVRVLWVHRDYTAAIHTVSTQNLALQPGANALGSFATLRQTAPTAASTVSTTMAVKTPDPATAIDTWSSTDAERTRSTDPLPASVDGNAVITINVGGTTSQVGDKDTSGLIAGALFSNQNTRRRVIEVVIKTEVNASEVFTSTGISTSASSNNELIRFRNTTNGEYKLGFLNNSRSGSGSAAFGFSTTVNAIPSGETATSAFVVGVLFQGSTAAFDLPAVDTSLGQTVNSLLMLQTNTINNNTDSKATDITNDVNTNTDTKTAAVTSDVSDDLDARKLTVSDVQKISRLIPV